MDVAHYNLAQDRQVAEREGLALTLVQGDMADLSALAEESFDLVLNPVSVCFVPDVRRVWREVYRVLRPGGLFLTGMVNPIVYLFDEAAAERDELIVRHPLPFSDLTSPTPRERERVIAEQRPLEFSHSLEKLIGGQLEAGFRLTACYEDWAPEELLARYAPSFLATRAIRP